METPTGRCAGCGQEEELEYHSSNEHVNSGQSPDVCQDCHDEGRP